MQLQVKQEEGREELRSSAHQFASASALALPSAMAFFLALIIVTNSARVQYAFALGAEKTVRHPP